MLIDTNIYSLALRGDPQIVETLRRAASIEFSAISIGELLFGLKNGKREQENREELAAFLDSPRVVALSIDEQTAEFYALILAELKKLARPIPTNNIWIAAVAMQHGLALFTRDSHFQAIPGLLLVG